MPWDFQEDPSIEVRAHARMSEYTTFRLGGPCRAMVTCREPEALARVVGELAARREPRVLIGWGSNILVSDAGCDTVVVRYASSRPSIRRQADHVEVSGSTLLDDLVRFTVAAGLDGLVCCTGIPGTVGGAIAGNAGAWGRQVADVLWEVALLDAAGRSRAADPAELGFAYRRSVLQEDGRTVLSARFRLSPASPEDLLRRREEILALRAARHPDLEVDPSIGSIFRNIEPTSAAGRRQAAGWFLEQAGAKEMEVGGARVFARHANIIVGGPGCTAQDVYDLARLMAAAVKDRFGLELIREVRFLGPFRGAQDCPPDRFF